MRAKLMVVVGILFGVGSACTHGADLSLLGDPADDDVYREERRRRMNIRATLGAQTGPVEADVSVPVIASRAVLTDCLNMLNDLNEAPFTGTICNEDAILENPPDPEPFFDPTTSCDPVMCHLHGSVHIKQATRAQRHGHTSYLRHVPRNHHSG